MKQNKLKVFFPPTGTFYWLAEKNTNIEIVKCTKYGGNHQVTNVYSFPSKDNAIEIKLVTAK